MDQDLKRIADRIRVWRHEAGLTLQQLGDRAGVSASTVHKIENLQTVPTIAVLLKVANGLNRRPSELLADPEVASQVSVVRRDERRSFALQDRAGLEHLIGMISRNRLDLWRAVLRPGIGAGYVGDAWEFPGELVILCESGRLDCEIAGKSFELRAGDSIHFDASQPHRWIAGGEGPASVMLFVLLPERLQADLITRLASAAAGGESAGGEQASVGVEAKIGSEARLGGESDRD